MSYIGTQQGAASPVLLDSITAVTGQAAYTLQKGSVNYSPASSLVMEVSLNGVTQAPEASYTISGSTLTFASNLIAGDVIDYVLVREPTTGTVSPVDGSVTDAKIASVAASKLTGALPAIDGSALTNVSSGSNILEQLFLNGNGDSVTVSSGTYSLSNITTFQSVNATYTDVTGSDISYTPPTGATQVVYEFNYAMYGVTTSVITHVKMFLDGNEITQARKTLNGGGSYDGQHVNHRWAIAIGGTADTASGRVATWTSPKILKLQVRYYNSSYAGDLHKMVYWDGGVLNQVVKPTMQITAYG